MRKIAGRSPGRPGIRGSAAALVVGLGLTLVLAVGCSSDEENQVGTGLVDTHLETVLDTILVGDITRFGPRAVKDPDVPTDDQELLFLGSGEGPESAILINYDFSDVYTDSFPESAFTAGNIERVFIRLRKPEFYAKLRVDPNDTNSFIVKKYYDIFQLDAPFDSTAYPGPVPPHGISIAPIGNEATIDPEDEAYASLPRVQIKESVFLSWLEAGTSQGVVIAEGEGSDPELLGFASRENVHGNSQFVDFDDDEILSPYIAVSFVDRDSTMLIYPQADVSTFHGLEEPAADPAEGITVRGGQRSYPVMRFDLESLPENVAINRAVLQLVNDTGTSAGPLESLVVSEFDMDYFGTATDTLTLDELADATYTLIGMTSLDPYYHDVMQFNVTQAVQRIINGVYEGERGFVVTLGEDSFPAYDQSTVDPDFYFNQFNFFGTAAADSLRPQLRITYSGIDELTGGAR